MLSLWPECAPYCAAIRDWGQLTLARYGHHTLSPPAGPRLAAIGDAAHSASPQLGQGANRALLDAAAPAMALRAPRSRTRSRLMPAPAASMSGCSRPCRRRSRLSTNPIREPCRSSGTGSWRASPASAFLAALVSGMLLDSLGRVGVVEPAWRDAVEKTGGTLPVSGAETAKGA